MITLAGQYSVGGVTLKVTYKVSLEEDRQCRVRASVFMPAVANGDVPLSLRTLTPFYGDVMNAWWGWSVHGDVRPAPRMRWKEFLGPDAHTTLFLAQGTIDAEIAALRSAIEAREARKEQTVGAARDYAHMHGLDIQEEG